LAYQVLCQASPDIGPSVGNTFAMMLLRTGMFGGERQSLCPHLVSCLRIMNLDHLLAPRSFVHGAILFGLVLSLVFGLMWGADVAQLYCLQSLPWSEGILGFGSFTCLYEAIGCVLFLRNAFDMILIVANYDQDEQAMLKERKNTLRQLLKQCQDMLGRVKDSIGDMHMMRVGEIAYLIRLYMEDQEEILLNFKRKWMERWSSTNVQNVFRALVIQMAAYVDEPERVAASLRQMTPQDPAQDPPQDQAQDQAQCNGDEADPEQDKRMKAIVGFLLKDGSLVDEQKLVIEKLKSDQFWRRARLKWLKDLFTGLVSCICFCLSSVCMCSLLTRASNDSSRNLYVFGEDDGQNKAMLAENGENLSYPEDVGMFVLAPLRAAIQRINSIKIPEDREEEGIQPRASLMIGQIGNPPSSRLQIRLLLRVFWTSLYLLLYTLICWKIFQDLFVLEGTKCQESVEKTFECKVALFRKLLGMIALVTYLCTTAVILWNLALFDKVMQVQMEILEMQGFKMDMEALDSRMFGASNEINDLLGKVRNQLERRLSIVREFISNEGRQDGGYAMTLQKYEDLSKKLAKATHEPDEHHRSRGGSPVRPHRRSSSSVSPQGSLVNPASAHSSPSQWLRGSICM